MSLETSMECEPSNSDLAISEAVFHRLAGDAMDILMRAYTYELNERAQGGITYIRRMYVGRDLYEAYEKGLAANMRYVSTDHDVSGYNGGIKFRSATLMIEGDGWDVKRFE